MQKCIPAFDMPVLQRVASRNKAIVEARRRKLSCAKKIVFLHDDKSGLPPSSNQDQHAPAPDPKPFSDIIDLDKQRQIESRLKVNRMRKIYVRNHTANQQHPHRDASFSQRISANESLRRHSIVSTGKSNQISRKNNSLKKASITPVTAQGSIPVVISPNHAATTRTDPSRSQDRPRLPRSTRRPGARISSQRYRRQQLICDQWFMVEIVRKREFLVFKIESQSGQQIYELVLNNKEAESYFKQINFDLQKIASYLTKRDGKVELILPETDQPQVSLPSPGERARRNLRVMGGFKERVTMDQRQLRSEMNNFTDRQVNSSDPRLPSNLPHPQESMASREFSIRTTNTYRQRLRPEIDLSIVKFNLQQTYTICEQEQPDSPHKLNYQYEQSLEEEVL